MTFPLIQFLHERGPRPAASKAEATALQYMESQFQAVGLETSHVVFPSFGGAEWYYVLGYALFPLTAMVFLEGVWPAFALATLGVVLLRLDLFIWPLLNRFLAWTSRSRAVTGRVGPEQEPRQTVIISANTDTRRILPFLYKWPFLERLAPLLMRGVDFLRVVHWLLYLVALIFSLFGMRDQVQLMWRLSWIPSLLCLVTAGCYLAQALHGVPVTCANDNLTGLQVLVDTASLFVREPCERTELVFAATGASHAGMLGAHFLFKTLKPSRERTMFLHLSALGGGRVAMAGSEGWSRPIYASDEMTDLGYLVGSTTPLPLEVVDQRQRRSDTAMARTLGFQGMTLIGLQPYGIPPLWLEEEQINPINLDHATDCVIRMIRTIDHQA